MIKLTESQIINIHKTISQQTGGDDGLRDGNLLQSAIQSPFQTFGEVDLYPTIIEKGARLGFGLISNHPFVDGNKRIGVLSLMVFLRLNNVNFAPPSAEVINIGLGVASGEISYEKLVEIIRNGVK